jgi:hypothetical protein
MGSCAGRGAEEVNVSLMYYCTCCNRARCHAEAHSHMVEACCQAVLTRQPRILETNLCDIHTSKDGSCLTDPRQALSQQLCNVQAGMAEGQSVTEWT